jgi:hypothetical protein
VVAARSTWREENAMSATSEGTPRLGFGGTRRVAAFFDLSVEQVRRLAATGLWPTYCVGGRRLFDLDELVRLVKASAAQPEGKK